MRCAQGFDGKPEERVHFEDPGVDCRIILRRIYRKLDVLDRAGSEQGQVEALVNAEMNFRFL